MSQLTGLSHLSLSVRDLEASVRWYCDVLGFTRWQDLKYPDGRHGVLCVLPGGSAVLGLQQHADGTGEPFDHRRTGLDHLAFAVADPADLDVWQRRFAELGVVHSPVAETGFGPVLCFRDPDDVQLEVFAMKLPE